jgi:hypothetical protein
MVRAGIEMLSEGSNLIDDANGLAFAEDGEET